MFLFFFFLWKVAVNLKKSMAISGGNEHEDVDGGGAFRVNSSEAQSNYI